MHSHLGLPRKRATTILGGQTCPTGILKMGQKTKNQEYGCFFTPFWTCLTMHMWAHTAVRLGCALGALRGCAPHGLGDTVTGLGRLPPAHSPDEMPWLWPHWRVQSFVVCPDRRRGGGVVPWKNSPSRALHPWSRCLHLKSTLGTPLKCPPPQGAPQGGVVQTEVGDMGALKNAQNKVFFPEG